MNHPKGLLGILSAELWERFSFYGLRSFLTLYMSIELLYNDELALQTYATFMSLLYVSPLLGGFLADRFLGKKLTICIGILNIIICHGVMCFLDSSYFQLGIACLVLGTGFFKSNIVSLVGSLYKPEDSGRDSAFTYFYTAVNIGAFLAPICGFFAQKPQEIAVVNFLPFVHVSPETLASLPPWEIGFGIAGIMACISFACFLLFGLKAETKENISVRNTPLLTKIAITALASLACAPILFVIKNHRLMDYIIPAAGLGSLVFWLYVTFSTPSKSHRSALYVTLVLMALHTLFMAILEQSGGSLALFMDRNLDRSLFGMEVPASTFQAVNPIYIIFFGPLLGLIWGALARKGKPVGTPLQFGLALMQMGAALFLLHLGCLFSNTAGAVHIGWFLFAYAFIASGELFITPIGLSLITRVAPQKFAGAMSAVWLLSIAFAHHLGGFIARLTMNISTGSERVSPLVSVQIYGDAFSKLGYCSLFIGLIAVAFSKKLNKGLTGKF